jgi:hypothetical protein
LFFVVVILLGVFFTMGYVLGRNTGVRPAAADDSTALSRPPAADAASGFGEPARKPAAASATPPAPVGQAAVQPSAALPETPPSGPPPSRETAFPQLTEPAAGQTFLQVMAVSRREAEIVLGVLKKKGFSARLAPGPEALVRVLVGPLADAGAIAATRDEIMKAGFDKPKPVPRKY